MLLHDLPDDVIRLILEAAFTPRSSVAATHRANLPLLAVCRTWRRLAAVAVFSGVAICYKSRPIRISGSDDDRANDPADGPDDAEISTNLDFVVSAGCLHTVKQVEITNHKPGLLSGLGAAVRLMRAAAEKWRSVRSLTISAFPGELTPVHGDDAVDYQSAMKQISAALAATMPGLRRVFFGGRPAGPVFREFSGQLAVLYSGQLERLNSHSPITVPRDHAFRQLERVSIWHDNCVRYQHPRVDPARLVSLNLMLWPSNHSWAPFSAGDDPGEILFPNLKWLSARYWPANGIGGAEARHRDDHPWRLHFPRLCRLEVECERDTCPLLEWAVLPPCMDEVSIRAPAPVLVRLAETGLPASRRLRINIRFRPNRNPAAPAAADHILRSARESNEVVLEIYDKSLPVLSGFSMCTSLTALTVQADTSVDTMLGLIRRFFNLAKLEILSLVLGDIQEDISIPAPGEICLAEPLSSKIKEIRIGVKLNEPVPGMLVPVAKCLLLRIPTLARFYFGRITRRPMAEFVGAYSRQYPHLAGIYYYISELVRKVSVRTLRAFWLVESSHHRLLAGKGSL